MRRVERLENLVREYMELKTLESELTASKNATAGEIKRLMDELQIDEYFADAATARYKEQVQRTIDSKALRKEMPNIASRYEQVKILKPLRIA